MTTATLELIDTAQSKDKRTIEFTPSEVIELWETGIFNASTCIAMASPGSK